MMLKIARYAFGAIGIALSILAAYMILLKITGHSPTVQEVILTILGIHISLFFGFAAQSLLFQGRMMEFKEQANRNFAKLHKELETMNSKL